MRRFTTRSFSLLSLSLLAVVSLSSCGGENKPGETADTTTAVGDTTPAAAAPDTASVPELDQMVNNYMVAADSLASLFERVKTVKEVEAYAEKIKEWNGVIQNFQGQSARYGQPLVDRMGAAGADGMLMRLVSSRDTLQQKYNAAYTKVLEIEAQATNQPSLH